MALAPSAAHVMNQVSRYRTVIEWTLSAAAAATVISVMLMMDTPVRSYADAVASTTAANGMHVRVPKPVADTARNAWRLGMDHRPLAAFGGVALVLVLFMRRMR
jgi:hypothetical protein